MENPVPRIDPEFKALIPPLSKEEYQQLEHNILSHNKCRDAIVTWRGIIVDGHNRFNVCVTHGISFEIKEMDFESREEAKLWILDNQLGRRNITDAMRIELALSKTELLRQKAKENQIRAGGDKTRAGALLELSSKPGEEPIDVRKAVADEAGLSDRTVQNYMHVLKHGNPELLERVKSGDIKIKTAFRLQSSELLKQLKRVDKLYSCIKKSIPIEGATEANQEIKARLIGLLGHLEQLQFRFK